MLLQTHPSNMLNHVARATVRGVIARRLTTTDALDIHKIVDTKSINTDSIVELWKASKTACFTYNGGTIIGGAVFFVGIDTFMRKKWKQIDDQTKKYISYGIFASPYVGIPSYYMMFKYKFIDNQVVFTPDATKPSTIVKLPSHLGYGRTIYIHDAPSSLVKHMAVRACKNIVPMVIGATIINLTVYSCIAHYELIKEMFDS